MKVNNIFNSIVQLFETSLPEKVDCSRDLLHSIGNGRDALLYSLLYCPSLVVISGSVLLEWNIVSGMEEKILLAKNGGPEALVKLESSINFIEVGYLFDGSNRNTTDIEDELLAHQILAAWQASLSVQFPHRKFVVEVLEPELTGSTVGVHFYQWRKEPEVR